MASNYVIHHQAALECNQRAEIKVTTVKDLLGHYRNILNLSAPGDVVITVKDRGEPSEKVLHIALVTKTCVIELDPNRPLPAGLDLPL